MVTINRTVVVVMAVEYMEGVVVGDEKAGGVELIRSEWREHPSEQREPLYTSLLAYVREIETTTALVTVNCTVVVVVAAEHVAGVVVGVDEAGGVELMISEWREQLKVCLRENLREGTSWWSLMQLRSVMAS